MSREIIGLICLAVFLIWGVVGVLFTNKSEDPKNIKQLCFIMALLGPLGVMLMFIMFIAYWIKAIYKKLA